MPTFIGSRGRIFHDSWQPNGPVRGAVVLLHGYGEHLGLYEALGRRLIADGLAGTRWTPSATDEATASAP